MASLCWRVVTNEDRKDYPYGRAPIVVSYHRNPVVTSNGDLIFCTDTGGSYPVEGFAKGYWRYFCVERIDDGHV